MIPPEMLLLAYRSGIFPMADSRDDPEIYWVEPRRRAVIPLDKFHCSRSLRKVLKQDRFTVTCNQAFPEVMRGCAAPRPDHPESWINNAITISYEALHAIGHAHSIECWLDDQLVGGLYGVSFDQVFCGESMFSYATNASKIALAWLVAAMRRAGFQLLDCQFITDHLASMGAVEISQKIYIEKLSAACRGKEGEEAVLPAAFQSLLDEAGASSPGKLIAQSLTQTS
ncbi:leucyl/phenylalanyl-tRNA--protein transferase [Altericroceibacterium spongiae]|uniref:Leucyl/phenylalanyl-tRNA--protein transferase n=2 Tax=Altericroceibacterium spongiae TaxID=2320269 RepID=A0A420EJQ9_9SPHN|nr:leucyl/phenylalanyl-tRNA--protein transferase [Altericroceibacterium spongiae]